MPDIMATRDDLMRAFSDLKSAEQQLKDAQSSIGPIVANTGKVIKNWSSRIIAAKKAVQDLATDVSWIETEMKDVVKAVKDTNA